MKNCDLMGLDGDLSELLPSGKRLHNYGKSRCLTGKSTISMAIFHSYVSLPEGKLLNGIVGALEYSL